MKHSDNTDADVGGATDMLNYYKELMHELKSPLNVIKAHAQYLLMNHEKSPDDVKEYLSIILSEVSRLETLLLEVDESVKKVKINLSLHNINDIILEVANKLRYEFDKKSVTLKYSLNKKLPKINIDRNKVCQVLFNIIKNAICAAAQGGTVEIATDIRDSLYIKIKDDGCGIKKSSLDDIFTPFYTTKQGGAGLGLYISKKIIDAHGGSITAASQVNRGTEFIISLPALR